MSMKRFAGAGRPAFAERLVARRAVARRAKLRLRAGRLEAGAPKLFRGLGRRRQRLRRYLAMGIGQGRQ